MKKRGVLILSGYNYRGIIAFSRFCKYRNIPFFIVAFNEEDLILRSVFRKNVILIRNSKSLQIKDFISCKKIAYEQKNISDLIILPSSEYLNRFLLNNREILEQVGFAIPLCSKELYERISNKYTFGEWCKEFKITVPKEYKDLKTAALPFVAKPKKYFLNPDEVNKRPFILKTKEDLFELQKLNLKDFYYQEYLGGNSYYLLYYFSKNKNYSVFSQENLIQQHNGLSIIGARSFHIHKKEIAKRFADLFLNSGFTGLVMIEIRFFENTYYMIEANPRLWGPSQLILDADMDLFDRFAFDYGLIELIPKTFYKEGIKYFWSGGIFEDQINKNDTSFYNYTKDDFFNEYMLWCTSDVYMKPDTQPIYYYELNKFIESGI